GGSCASRKMLLGASAPAARPSRSRTSIESAGYRIPAVWSGRCRIPRMMSGRKAEVLLVTVALLVAPLAGVVLLLYGAGEIAARRPRRPAADPYVEWLAL